MIFDVNHLLSDTDPPEKPWQGAKTDAHTAPHVAKKPSL